MLLAVLVGEEDETGLHEPVLFAGVDALYHFLAVNIDGSVVVLAHKDDAVPLPGIDGAVVAQSGVVQSDLSILDEEAGVLLVGDFVLEEGGKAFCVVQLDVHEERIGGDFFEARYHEQTAFHRSIDGIVACGGAVCR